MISWINTVPCSRRIVDALPDELNTEEGYKEWVRKCKQFGVLCKKASMMRRTSCRLELLSKWFLTIESRLLRKIDNKDWARLMSKVGLAAALSKLFLGWQDSEFWRVDEWLVDQGHILEGEGSRSLRIFLWEFLENDFAKTSWLIHLLQNISNYSLFRPSTNQEQNSAYFLYSLLGPAKYVPSLFPQTGNYNPFQISQHTKLQGRPDWAIVQEQPPTNYQEAEEVFSDLGKAVRLLVASCRDNSCINHTFLNSMITSLFEESNWSLDNQATFLMFSSSLLVQMFLTNLAKRKGGLLKLTHTIVSMVVVCERLQNDLNQNRNLSQLIDWCFTLLVQSKGKAIIAEFWKEAVERIEEGSMGERMLVQLGMFIGGRAYPECQGSRQLQTMEIEE